MKSEPKFYSVTCEETGETYRSIRELAVELGMSISNIKGHLERGTPINGKHYIKVESKCQKCVRYRNNETGEIYCSDREAKKALGNLGQWRFDKLLIEGKIERLGAD